MSSLAKKVLCVNLRTSCLGTTFLSSVLTTSLEESTGAARGKVKGSKKILGDAIKPIAACLREAGSYVKSVTLPGISDDLRLVTPKRLEEVRAKIFDAEEKVTEMVEKFSEVVEFAPKNPDGTLAYDPRPMTLWESYIEQDRVSLAAAFDPTDYPPLENLPQHFTLRLTVCDLPAGDYFRVEGLTEDAITKMKADHERMIGQVSAMAKNEVHRKLVELIGRIAENLDRPDISKLHNTTFTNLQDYLDKVPDLNITNDPVLEAMRAEAQNRLNVTMAQVKASAVLQEQAASAAKDILSRFGGGKRKLLMTDPAPTVPLAEDSAA